MPSFDLTLTRHVEQHATIQVDAADLDEAVTKATSDPDLDWHDIALVTVPLVDSVEASVAL